MDGKVEPFVYRKASKIVGYMDTVVMTCWFGFDLFATAVLDPGADNRVGTQIYHIRAHFEANQITPSLDGADQQVIYAFVGWTINCFLTFSQIAGAIALTNAAGVGKNHLGALKMCRYWYWNNFTIMGIYSVWRIFDRTWLVLVVYPVCRIPCMFLVWKFILELEIACFGYREDTELNGNLEGGRRMKKNPSPA